MVWFGLVAFTEVCDWRLSLVFLSYLMKVAFLSFVGIIRGCAASGRSRGRGVERVVARRGGGFGLEWCVQGASSSSMMRRSQRINIVCCCVHTHTRARARRQGRSLGGVKGYVMCRQAQPQPKTFHA